MIEETKIQEIKRIYEEKKLVLAIIAGLIVFSFLVYACYQIFIPLRNFPVGKDFRVTKEETGGAIFSRLKEEGFIRNVFWAKVVTKLTRRNKFYRGDFQYDAPKSLYQILFDITTRPPTLAVLIPEGFTEKQVADRLEKYIKHFDKKDFLAKAEEGYLFPDTYFFYPYLNNDEILNQFRDKLNQEMLVNFGRMPTKQEIIIASMIEREARDPKDMKLVSGVIQNRLKIGMPLQIDATVLYAKGVRADRVLYKDLCKESDYNTYQKTGLPIGPISNPGINAIRAAIYPDSTKYMYYITGRDGKFYYALTHEDHVKNIAKYLR
jgi:UPF0755 protein